MEAAAQIFERHGYAAGTTNRIAERAGVSIGSIYQYFAGKDELLRAVAEQHLADAGARVGAELAAIDGDPEPQAAIAGVLQALIELHRDRPRLHRILFEEAPLPAGLRATVRDFEAAAAAHVAAYLARRPVPPPEPLVTARLLVEAVEAWAHRFVIHPHDDEDEAAFVDAAARLLAAGL